MKRTKRKNIRFTKSEWDTVCRKAERLKMKPATFIRNMALCDKWIAVQFYLQAAQTKCIIPLESEYRTV